MKKLLFGTLLGLMLLVLPVVAFSGCAKKKSSGTEEEPQYTGPQYEVVFDAPDVGYRSVSLVKPGEKVKLPVNVPAKTGMKVEGWYVDAGLTEWFNEKTAVNDNITLYAKFMDANLYISTSGGNAHVYDCKSNAQSVVIPEIYHGVPVTTVGNDKQGENAFYGCTKLTEVVIPNSVTRIGKCAFYGCAGLTNISLPDSVASIGDSAFSTCGNLETITLPENLKAVEAGAFFNCNSLNRVNYLGTIAQWCGIEFGSFGLYDLSKDEPVLLYNNANPLENAYLFIDGHVVSSIKAEDLEGVTEIGHYAFYRCRGLYSVEIPNTVEKIGEGAFGNCMHLTTVTAPIVPNCTFYRIFGFGGGCYVKTVNITNTADIKENEFAEFGAMEEISLPEGIKNIGKWAFSWCTSLEEIVIPDSVESIGERIFNLCTSLKKITLPLTENIVFSNLIDSDNELLEIVNVSSGEVKYGEFANPRCGSIKEINLSDRVTSVGDFAFAGCNITKITIASSVTSVGAYAFSNCQNLANVVIDSIDVYTAADGVENTCAGGLLANATTVYVLKSIIDEHGAVNNYLRDNFTQTSGSDEYADYYLFTEN